MLTQEELKNIATYDRHTGVFTATVTRGVSKVGSPLGTTTLQGYTQIQINYKSYRANRLAWLYTYGTFPTKSLDHIDQNKQNDAISNLREVTVQENAQNARMYSTNTSGRVGVYRIKKTGKWEAQIKVKGKITHGKSRVTFEEAVKDREALEIANNFHPNHGRK